MTIEKRRILHIKERITERGNYIAEAFYLVAYRPHKTKKGVWKWKKHKDLDMKTGMEGLQFILASQKIRPKKGGIHFHPMSFNEILAIDAAQDGMIEQVNSLGLEVIED